MIIDFKDIQLRTGYDAENASSAKKGKYSCWAADFERELVEAADHYGIDLDLIEADIDDCNDLRKNPKTVARHKVLAAAKMLCII